MIWVVIKQNVKPSRLALANTDRREGLAGQKGFWRRCSSPGRYTGEIISEQGRSKCQAQRRRQACWRASALQEQWREWRTGSRSGTEEQSMLSLSPCNSAWLLKLQKGHSGIWKIAETEGKTGCRETQQHQQGQPLLHCPDRTLNLLGSFSGTPVLSP